MSSKAKSQTAGKNADEEAEKISYHYGFYAAVQYKYEGAGDFEFFQEHELGKHPPRIDMLVINSGNPPSDAIGRFFRKYNVFEYKSPDAGLSIDDFFKVQGYACFYKGRGERVNERPLKEMTISIFRHRYPREMFAALEREGYTVTEFQPGIYYIAGALCVPTQVIVTSRLAEGNYEAFKILAKNAREEDITRFLKDARRTKNRHTSSILRVSMAANKELYQNLEEANPMKDVVKELFHDMFAECEAKGRAEGAIKTLYALIRKGLLTLKDAASELNMTEPEFKAQMAALGY